MANESSTQRVCPWVEKLTKKIEEKDGFLLLPELEVARAMEDVRAESAADREKIAEELMAIGMKLMRSSPTPAMRAVEQLCAITAVAMAEPEKNEFRREKPAQNDTLSKWTGRTEVTRAPVFAASAPGGTFKASSHAARQMAGRRLISVR